MANTPNIDLVKPAGTDHALVSVLNSNSDKIDSFAGTTNQAISDLLNVPATTYNGDLNTLITNGYYILGSSATNTPPVTATGKLKVEDGGNTNYKRQTYYCGYDSKIYTRIRYYSNGSWLWSAWQQLILKSDITPLYTTTGLTATNATISNGGYAKIGGLVVVNLRLDVTTQISAGATFLTGLPSYSSLSTGTLVTVQNNRNLDISVTAYGNMSVSNSPIPTGTLLVNCVYIGN